MKKIALAFIVVPMAIAAAPSSAPTIEQFLAPGYPTEIVSAKNVDRIAWTAYEHGERNVYTAAAPDFKPVRLTHFLEDDGVELSDVAISDEGRVVTFVRGTQPNREGWVADPTSDPAGAERTVWAAETGGAHEVWKIGEVTTPALSPDGRTVVFAKEGQIYSYAVGRVLSDPPGTAKSPDPKGRGVPLSKRPVPLIKAWGTNANPVWSPDGTRIAFVSDRVDHSLIGIYDLHAKAVTFMAPSVDHDTSPTWSPDGTRVAFIRRPGTPFGLQAHQGSGSIGNPDGPAYDPLAALRGRGRGGSGRSGRAGGSTDAARANDDRPGLYSAAFADGSTLSFWVADAATGEAKEFWHDQKDDKAFNAVAAIRWSGSDHVIFEAEPQEWVRWYSVSVSNAQPAPVMLTPGDGAVEQTALAKDGATLFYTTNAGDVERRHIWKVPIAGGAAEPITRGDTIESYPAALASGRDIAVLGGDAKRPFGVGIVPAAGSSTGSGRAVQYIYPSLNGFPIDAEVVPQLVMTKAPDGLDTHNQLFLPKDLRPGEKRPAIIFVHGGPVRQMLLGYHYMHFYHIAYAVNQWLASQGYVVMSVNYRSGIGYGKSFRTAPNTGGRGNAEYQDVLAGGEYLKSRPDVDPNRIGIWGLSYGGVLTSQALARNSDLFKVGVDMAGVHLWGSSLDPDNVSYRASTVGAIDGWKSPVLLIQGDDDRNVQFSQMTGLVQLLRAHHVPFELIVYPDDTHEPLLHKRYLNSFNRMSAFLGRYLKPPSTTTTLQ